MPPPPGCLPSRAVTTKPYLPFPPTVPLPLHWALLPEMTNHSYDVLANLKFAAWNWSCVAPVGTAWPLSYFELKAKLTFPVGVGLAVEAPAGEAIQPPPVTNPPVASKAARRRHSWAPVLPAESVPWMQMLWMPAAAKPGSVAATSSVAVSKAESAAFMGTEGPPSTRYRAEAMVDPPVVRSLTVAVSAIEAPPAGAGFGPASGFDTTGPRESPVAIGKDCGTSGAAFMLALPAWCAVTVQLPGPVRWTSAPATEQLPEAVNVTGSPELADAATPKSGSPKVFPARAPKAIVWDACAIENVCGASAAARMFELPAWCAVIAQLPASPRWTSAAATEQLPAAEHLAAKAGRALAAPHQSDTPNVIPARIPKAI